MTPGSGAIANLGLTDFYSLRQRERSRCALHWHLWFAGSVDEITLHPRPASRSFAGDVETDHPHESLLWKWAVVARCGVVEQSETRPGQPSTIAPHRRHARFRGEEPDHLIEHLIRTEHPDMTLPLGDDEGRAGAVRGVECFRMPRAAPRGRRRRGRKCRHARPDSARPRSARGCRARPRNEPVEAAHQAVVRRSLRGRPAPRSSS